MSALESINRGCPFVVAPDPITKGHITTQHPAPRDCGRLLCPFCGPNAIDLPEQPTEAMEFRHGDVVFVTQDRWPRTPIGFGKVDETVALERRSYIGGRRFERDRWVPIRFTDDYSYLISGPRVGYGGGYGPGNCILLRRPSIVRAVIQLASNIVLGEN